MPDKATTPHALAHDHVNGLRGKLIELSALLMLVPVMLPLAVVFTRALYFHVDPRSLAPYEVIPEISFGPAGSMWLAVASVLIAAWVLAVSLWAGAKVRWGACILFTVGAVSCLIHMPGHLESRLHGGAWIAAASLGLAVAHLGRFARAKRLILAGLIALTLPLFLQAAWYAYVEHPATVETFHSTESQALAARGFEPGSAEHTKYVTRLEGRDVIGAVGMSNVLGSIVATLTVLALVAGVGGLRSKATLVRVLLGGGALLIGGWTLVLTQSKGAVLAFCAVLGLGVCVLGAKWLGGKWRRLIPTCCMLLVIAGITAVLVRGALGPPDTFEGERSLLFRFHYWQGAARLLQDQPSRIVLGVGPAAFKQNYEAVRNPISPEVVTSTHNVLVDFAVMLGLGGCAWGVLLLWWLWRAGVGVCCDGGDEFATSSRAPPVISRAPPVRLFALLGSIVFGIQLFVQYPGLYAPTAILWLVGTLGFIGLSAYVVYPLVSGSPAWVNLGAMLAAALVLLHAQIEMTFFWDSSVAFVWVIVGLASACSSDRAPAAATKSRPVRYLPAVGLLALTFVLAFAHAEPVARHQARLASASAALSQSGLRTAIAELDQAALIIGNDPTTLRWQVQLRQDAASALFANARPDEAQAVLEQVQAVLDRAERSGLTGLGAARRRGASFLGGYQITSDRAWLRRAEMPLRRAVELSPSGLNDHIRLADTLWQLGAFDAAEDLYRKALKISDGFYLDPQMRLPKPERRRIEARIGGEDTPR